MFASVVVVFLLSNYILNNSFFSFIITFCNSSPCLIYLLFYFTHFQMSQLPCQPTIFSMCMFTYCNLIYIVNNEFFLLLFCNSVLSQLFNFVSLFQMSRLQSQRTFFFMCMRTDFKAIHAACNSNKYRPK